MVRGPSQNGVGVIVSVEVPVDVGVRVSVDVLVVVLDCVGVGVREGSKVGVVGTVFCSVGPTVETLAVGWEDICQAATREIPSTRLMIQKPVTNRLHFSLEEAAI